MPIALRFYRDVLGFAEVEKSGQGDDVGWAWFPHDNAAAMLTPLRRGGSAPQCQPLGATSNQRHATSDGGAILKATERRYGSIDGSRPAAGDERSWKHLIVLGKPH